MEEEEEVVNKTEIKNKMDLFREAIDLGMKNMEVDDEKQEQDLLSVSDTSLSQSIFENTRLPPYFGTHDFATKTFMNLFNEEDLNEARISKQEFSVHEIKI